MLPYYLRHYSTFCDKIILFDENSSDGSRELVKACPKAELRDWPHRGLDDNRFIEAVNHCYKEARGKANWVMWPDVDEILWHPDPLGMLLQCRTSAVQALGFGMISKEGPPNHADQIYETVRHGVRQDNYDKVLIWKPEIDIVHQIGRHTTFPTWPQGVPNVTRAEHSGWKLLHYHYFGLDYTADRNRRNYLRAPDKKLAWNYDPKHNANPKQNGSLAWVKAALESNSLVEVVENTTMPYSRIIPKAAAGPLKKLHLGCGPHHIPGWENFDAEVDIRNPLPFPDGSASHVFAEHVVEHMTHQQAWNFFEECFRVLTPGGVVRIAIPDFNRTWVLMNPTYKEAVKKGGHGDGTDKSSMKAMVFNHGHQAVWNQDLLGAMLEVIGFDVSLPEWGESSDVFLKQIEQHGKTVGDEIAKIETGVAEGVKPGKKSC